MKNISLWLKEFAKKHGFRIVYRKDGANLVKEGKYYLAKKYAKTIRVTIQEYLGAWTLKSSLIVVRVLGWNSFEYQIYDWKQWYEVIEELKDYLDFMGEKIKLKLTLSKYYKKIVIPVNYILWNKWIDKLKKEKVPRTELLRKMLSYT